MSVSPLSCPSTSSLRSSALKEGLSICELADFLDGKYLPGEMATESAKITHWIPLARGHSSVPDDQAATFIAASNTPYMGPLPKVGVVLTCEDLSSARSVAQRSAGAKARLDRRCSQIIVDDPYLGFARASALFYRSPPASPPCLDPGGSYWREEHVEVHPNAHVYPGVYLAHGAQISEGVVIHPGCYVGAGSSLGDHTQLLPNVTVLDGCVIGRRCLIHPGVTMGADGFGFVPDPQNGGLVKIYHLGGLVVGDDVEVGCSVNLHRGTIDNTSIGSGTKIDTHVQVGHNVTVGGNNIIASGAALAGSSSTGDHVVLGPRCVVTNKAHVSSGLRVGAMSAVSKTLNSPGDYFGIPAIPLKKWKRRHGVLMRLVKIYSRGGESSGPEEHHQ